MQLILENVSHIYQPGTPFAATALDQVNLTLHEREFLALIGHTGSGKSTLAQHFNGLLKPTSGQVFIAENGQKLDINAPGSDRKSLRQRIGLVFQYPEYQLFEETVIKDTAFGPRNMGLSDEEIAFRVRSSLQRVGLPIAEVGEKSPFELSGGQMRRVAIAGVLAMLPDVLVLDEPTAGLDPVSRNELLDCIAGFHREGTTVVMISHNMDDVAKYATRILVMAHGTIAMDGKPNEVFSRSHELMQLGLDIPQVCQLGLKLREQGIAFPDCYQEQDAVEALFQLMGGNKHAK